jgi:hypothetical protein
MENLDKKEEGNTCGGCSKAGCPCGGVMGHMHGCCGGKYHLVKMILKIVFIIIIFWCGFKLGEMTGYIKAEGGVGYGRGGFQMMRGGGNFLYSNNLPGNGGAVTAPVPAQ